LDNGLQVKEKYVITAVDFCRGAAPTSTLLKVKNTKAQGVWMYLYSFFNLGARWGWVVNATPRLL
jgi:hypothetical protein